VGERLSIDRKKALRRHYALRRTGEGGKSIETTIPREVVEREARRRGLGVDEFLNEYVAEVLYDDFQGVIVTFAKREELS